MYSSKTQMCIAEASTLPTTRRKAGDPFKKTEETKFRKITTSYTLYGQRADATKAAYRNWWALGS